MSIAEYYYDLLKKPDGNKVNILVNLYKAIFDLENIPSDFYARIGRIVKLYGDDITFFSILDCSEVPSINHDNPYGLILFFTKKRLSEKYTSLSMDNLSKLSTKNLEYMTKKRRIKVPEIENE